MWGDRATGCLIGEQRRQQLEGMKRSQEEAGSMGCMSAQPLSWLSDLLPTGSLNQTHLSGGWHSGREEGTAWALVGVSRELGESPEQACRKSPQSPGPLKDQGNTADHRKAIVSPDTDPDTDVSSGRCHCYPPLMWLRKQQLRQRRDEQECHLLKTWAMDGLALWLDG